MKQAVLLEMLPGDLKKEVSRYLFKKYYDVVLDELLLVTKPMFDNIDICSHNGCCKPAVEISPPTRDMGCVRWIRTSFYPIYKNIRDAKKHSENSVYVYW